MTKTLLAAALIAALGASPVLAQSSTGGSAGTASTGGTSASTLGVGGRSEGSAALGMGGSAAAVDGRTQSRSAVHGNNNLNGQAMAQAHDGGTFSRSHTVCHNRDEVSCRTKSMAHEPGSAPVKSESSTEK